jgi:hypothetical protein
VTSLCAKLIGRVLAIVVGCYAASAALVAAGTASLRLTGVTPGDAFTLCSISGFLVYLGLALWAAAARRLTWLIAVLALLTASGVAIVVLAGLVGGA